jgi:hypothetical protein
MTNEELFFVRRNILLTYLNTYISKKTIRMKGVMKGIRKTLLNDERISKKQLYLIVKYIERESRFINMNRDSIYEYFNPILVGSKELKERQNDLTEFFI